MAIQAQFKPLVGASEACCVDRFGDRLAAVYLAGSVAAGEAWPGASDLDWFAFLHDSPTPADKAWMRRTRKSLQNRFPVVSEVHLNLHPLDRLRREGFSRFILRYNSMRLRGVNVVAFLEREGIRTPRPSRTFARTRLAFMRSCLSEAMAGRTPPALDELPADPFLAARKLARNFVIVEGAYVLMCKGTFRSFMQHEVLHDLRRGFPRWRRLLKVTETILADPHKAGVRPADLMTDVGPFMQWAIRFIEEA